MVIQFIPMINGGVPITYSQVLATSDIYVNYYITCISLPAFQEAMLPLIREVPHDQQLKAQRPKSYNPGPNQSYNLSPDQSYNLSPDQSYNPSPN